MIISAVTDPLLDTNEALAFYDSVQSVKHQVNSLIAAKRRAPPIAAGRVPPPPPTSTNNPQVGM